MKEKLGGSSSFKASTGLLRNFQSRHGIRSLDIQGERLSSNGADADEFKNNFSEFLVNEDDVYNVDEIGLDWRTLLSKSLASKRERSAPGYKVSKERVTIKVCANASGTHRLPLLMIGKSKKPRCFENVKNLPFRYKAQSNV